MSQHPPEAPFFLTQADAQALVTALQFADMRCLTATPAERELEARLQQFVKNHWPAPTVAITAAR